MIVLADTLIYIGQLGELFNHAKNILKMNGLILFSTEDLERSPMKSNKEKLNYLNSSVLNNNGIEYEDAIPGWGGEILSSARFAHSNTYIQLITSLHGFSILSHREGIVLRTEESVPIPGNMFICQKVS